MPVIFNNREEAGVKLADTYKGHGDNAIILGIPRGGLPVGYPLAEALDTVLDVIIVRKLPIPGNPEAGFGAVAPDGSLVLNDEIAAQYLSKEDIEKTRSMVLKEVRRREKRYRGDRPFPTLRGMNVVITDDGLATGYTMIAAIDMVKKQNPASVAVAVPVGPANTVSKIESRVDYFHCLYVSRGFSFAVADFYRDFHDMDDKEVIAYLNKQNVKYWAR